MRVVYWGFLLGEIEFREEFVEIMGFKKPSQRRIATGNGSDMASRTSTKAAANDGALPGAEGEVPPSYRLGGLRFEGNQNSTWQD